MTVHDLEIYYCDNDVGIVGAKDCSCTLRIQEKDVTLEIIYTT